MQTTLAMREHRKPQKPRTLFNLFRGNKSDKHDSSFRFAFAMYVTRLILQLHTAVIIHKDTSEDCTVSKSPLEMAQRFF